LQKGFPILLRRFLPIALAAQAFSPAAAQTAPAPWITATLGVELLHRSIRTTSLGTLTENHNYPIAGVALQLPLRSIVRPELSVRSSLGSGSGFRSAKVGFTIRPLRRAGAQLGVAVARTDYWEGAACINSGPCGGADHFSQWHLEVSGGFDFPQGSRISLGPALWILQPLRGAQLFKSHFRVFGAGFRLGFQ